MSDNVAFLKRVQSTGVSTRPKHKISYNKKRSAENGEPSEWGVNAIDYYATQTSITASMRTEMRVLYRLANGEFDESDYSHVLNPLGEVQRKRESLQGDPAKLRNYDIISSVVSRIVGDYMMRDTNYQVIATNSDVEERRQSQIRASMREALMQEFRNQLATQGMDTGFTQEDMQGLGQQVEQILNQAENVPDTMTMKGQNALDYITKFNEIERKLRELLTDFITVGRVYSYRDVFRNDTVYEGVHPMEIDYLANANEEFVENGECATHTMKLPVTEVIDMFRDELSDTEIDWLEEQYGGNQFNRDPQSSNSDLDMDWRAKDTETMMRNVFGVRRNRVMNGLTVKHVTFRSKKKLGLLEGINPFGEEIYIEVDEDFKPRAHEEVEWVWVDEIWEGYKINQELYKRIRPIPLQRGTANDPSACTLPYNGRTYGHRTSLPNTPVKTGKAYQEMYNIIKYRLERTIAKNKDKITLMPYSVVPDNKDMDMFSMMYYGDTTGYLFVDDSDPKVLQALQHVRAIDLSMREYIKFLHDIAIGLRAEYLEILGIPRQAMADIKASDDVGNTTAALNQGSLILEPMFVSFEEFVEKDYQALLDLSKFAWVDGKKEKFLNANGELTWLDIDPYMHTATDFSIFVKGNKQEREKLREMRALTQAFAQNSATPTMIGRILQANNFDTLMKELEKMEMKMQQSQASAQEAEQQAQQAELQDKEQEREYQYYKVDQDNKTKVDVALIGAESSLASSMQGQTEGESNGDAINRGNEVLDDLFTRGQDTATKYADIQQKRDAKAIDYKIAKENTSASEIQAKKNK